MKIKKVRIRNFRSIIDTGEIDIDEKITLLLGKNEQGKTNFLKALESFGMEWHYVYDDLSYLVEHDLDDSSIPITTIWFKIEDIDKQQLHHLEEIYDELMEGDIVITKYFDGHYDIEQPDINLFMSREFRQSIFNLLNEIPIEESYDLLNRIDREKHVSWLKSHQRPDGGFSYVPGQPSNIDHTHYSVKALEELGSLNQIKKNELVKFITSCQHPNGGFGNMPDQQPHPQYTYYALTLLKGLKALNKIEKAKHVSWLKSHQKPDGGFSYVLGQPSNIAHTYYSVKALEELGSLNQINKNELVKFITSCQHPNGGFGNMPDQQPHPQYTYYALALLKGLKALNKIEKAKHVSWLKSHQRPDGGFSYVPGQPSNIAHTYYSVKALEELGSLNQINKNELVKFIISCQYPNGGFGNMHNQQLHPQYTYYALTLLKGLGIYLLKDYKNNLTKLHKEDSKMDEIENIVNDILLSVLDEETKKTIKTRIDSLKDEIKKTFEELKSKIMLMVPNFMYFDSIDLVKDTVSINDYLKNKEGYKTFTKLFQLAGLDIDRIKTIGTPHKRKLLFRKASQHITGKINDFWLQEEVKVNLDIDGDQILVFIEDDTGAKADPPSRRSDGFRWFLSFYINFMAASQGELKDTILLLDNLGWVLHPSGQRDLLKTLDEIAQTNQIIFATHSPFLIDKNKLERIRIVERKVNIGTKVYQKFWDSMYDSLQVIRASIGANISDSLFGHKNNIVVEGYSDKLFLETVNSYLKRKGSKKAINMDKVMTIGAGGADKVPYLLSWFKAEKYNSLALLDADKEGKGVIQKLKDKNIEVDKTKDILTLDEISEEFKGKEMEMEDLFDEKFYNIAVNRAYKEIFKNKLKRTEIHINDIPSTGLRTKRYGKFFKNNKLGGFDKVKVALEIKKMLSEDNTDSLGLPEKTINTFEQLFEKIKEKFKNKGVENL